jgi:hypothetical protein
MPTAAASAYRAAEVVLENTRTLSYRVRSPSPSASRSRALRVGVLRRAVSPSRPLYAAGSPGVVFSRTVKQPFNALAPVEVAALRSVRLQNAKDTPPPQNAA